jgi:hypothetical protein
LNNYSVQTTQRRSIVGKRTKTSEGLFVEGQDKQLKVKKPIYKSLFFQIILAIIVGVTIGAV